MSEINENNDSEELEDKQPISKTGKTSKEIIEEVPIKVKERKPKKDVEIKAAFLEDEVNSLKEQVADLTKWIDSTKKIKKQDGSGKSIFDDVNDFLGI